MTRRRKKFELIHDNCKRCGKPIVRGNRSLFGNETLRAKYGGICCLTADEKAELYSTNPLTGTK